MRVAMVTMKVKAGKCEENFAFMKAKIEQAMLDQANMIVFPQNAISGYLLGDLWLDDAWCRYVDSFNERLIALSDQIVIVWGNIKYRRHRRFNAMFYAYQKETLMRVKKNNDTLIMSDSRYFTNNDINSAIDYQDEVFALNFQNEIQLADMNINVDANAYDMDEDLNLFGNIIYVNAVGMQNTGKNVMVMRGGSRIMKNKKLLYHAPYFTQDYAVVDLDCEDEVQAPPLRLVDAMRLGIQDFDAQTLGGKLPWIVGLSGGLDSSITCALLAYSLGKERVHAYNLATKYNSAQTINNALQEATRLGVHYHEGNLEAFLQASSDLFQDQFHHDVHAGSSLIMENMQARARGYVLNTLAGILGGVVVNNANKIEAALGYCTLYGDSIGAISLIGDLHKVQLFTLAQELNAIYQQEIIPHSLLPDITVGRFDWTMPPSAELKDLQRDPMKWFYHDYLLDHLGKDESIISIMKKYLDGSLCEGALKRWFDHYGLHDPKTFLEDLEWLTHTIEKNGFKRLQLPPLLTLHKETFANRIESQLQYDKQMYEQLKAKILMKA